MAGVMIAPLPQRAWLFLAQVLGYFGLGIVATVKTETSVVDGWETVRIVGKPYLVLCRRS
jgi:VanZ family protein